MSIVQCMQMARAVSASANFDVEPDFEHCFWQKQKPFCSQSCYTPKVQAAARSAIDHHYNWDDDAQSG